MTYFQDPKVRLFVGHILHKKAKTNFLKHAKFIGKRDSPPKLLGINERFFTKIYQYRFEKTISNVSIYKDDFIYSKWKPPTDSFPFHESTFKLNDDIPNKIKKIILPDDKIANGMEKIPVPDNL